MGLDGSFRARRTTGSCLGRAPACSHDPLLIHQLTVFQAPRARRAVCRLCCFTSELGGHQTPEPWAGSAAQGAPDCVTFLRKVGKPICCFCYSCYS